MVKGMAKGDLTREERLQIMLTPEELTAVDNYRFAASGFGLRPDHETFARELRMTPLFADIERTEPAVFDDIAEAFNRSYAPSGRPSA